MHNWQCQSEDSLCLLVSVPPAEYCMSPWQLHTMLAAYQASTPGQLWPGRAGTAIVLSHGCQRQVAVDARQHCTCLRGTPSPKSQRQRALDMMGGKCEVAREEAVDKPLYKLN